MQTNEEHRCGWIAVVGRPNVGKSTLVNSLVGFKVSAVTWKAQTTRRRILGIVNGDNYQLILIDTPGVLEPAYELHRRMLKQIHSALESPDVVLLMVDHTYTPDTLTEYQQMADIITQIRQQKLPVVLAINKIDLLSKEEIEGRLVLWRQWHAETFDKGEVLGISAIRGDNLPRLKELLISYLPVSPPHYPKDQITDINERLFIAEIIREKIFLYYRQEVPYSTEVFVDHYEEKEDITYVHATIYVEKLSQKKILIGKGGHALKKIGTEARKELEELLGKRFYLELYVKVREGWRSHPGYLSALGYK